MNTIEAVSASDLPWETVSEGVKKCMLRSLPGEKRTLIRIGARRKFPVHAHAAPDEEFVVDGVYIDPQVENGQEFGGGVPRRDGAPRHQPQQLHNSGLECQPVDP